MYGWTPGLPLFKATESINGAHSLNHKLNIIASVWFLRSLPVWDEHTQFVATSWLEIKRLLAKRQWRFRLNSFYIATFLTWPNFAPFVIITDCTCSYYFKKEFERNGRKNTAAPLDSEV